MNSKSPLASRSYHYYHSFSFSSSVSWLSSAFAVRERRSRPFVPVKKRRGINNDVNYRNIRGKRDNDITGFT